MNWLPASDLNANVKSRFGRLRSIERKDRKSLSMVKGGSCERKRVIVGEWGEIPRPVRRNPCPWSMLTRGACWDRIWARMVCCSVHRRSSCQRSASACALASCCDPQKPFRSERSRTASRRCATEGVLVIATGVKTVSRRRHNHGKVCAWGDAWLTLAYWHTPSRRSCTFWRTVNLGSGGFAYAAIGWNWWRTVSRTRCTCIWLCPTRRRRGSPQRALSSSTFRRSRKRPRMCKLRFWSWAPRAGMMWARGRVGGWRHSNREWHAPRGCLLPASNNRAGLRIGSPAAALRWARSRTTINWIHPLDESRAGRPASTDDKCPSF